MCFLEALFFLFCIKAVMRLSQLKYFFSNRQVYTFKKTKQTKNKTGGGILIDYVSSAAAFL